MLRLPQCHHPNKYTLVSPHAASRKRHWPDLCCRASEKAVVSATCWRKLREPKGTPRMTRKRDTPRSSFNGASAGHDIVVIGASTGGVEALISIVRDLPPELPAAVFVVMHLSPQSPSHLPEI